MTIKEYDLSKNLRLTCACSTTAKEGDNQDNSPSSHKDYGRA